MSNRLSIRCRTFMFASHWELFFGIRHLDPFESELDCHPNWTFAGTITVFIDELFTFE